MFAYLPGTTSPPTIVQTINPNAPTGSQITVDEFSKHTLKEAAVVHHMLCGMSERAAELAVANQNSITLNKQQWDAICDVIGAAKVVAGRAGTIRSCLELAGQRKSSDAVKALESAIDRLEETELDND